MNMKKLSLIVAAVALFASAAQAEVKTEAKAAAPVVKAEVKAAAPAAAPAAKAEVKAVAEAADKVKYSLMMDLLEQLGLQAHIPTCM